MNNERKPKKQVKPFSPFSLILVIPGFVLYLIFGYLTYSIGDKFTQQVTGSFRLLILTMTLFFLVAGLMGYIIYEDDRMRFHKYLKHKLKLE